MVWIIGLLTVVLVLDCLFLMLLVLIQLPKKEAGLGTAFGGGATDALFGAGTGTALTKLTKYSTVIFFVLTLMLSVLNAHHSKSQRSRFTQTLGATPLQQPPGAATNESVQTPPAASATNLLTTPPTNAPAPATTNLLSTPSVPAPEASAPAPTTPTTAPPTPGNPE